jgi:hypothetical protein
MARVAIAILLVVLFAAGCGQPGHGAETDSEKGSDVEILNAALGRELTVLAAYTQGMPRIGPRFALSARRLRAQEQEYVSAIAKAIRGVGGRATGTASEIDTGELHNQKDVLTLAYELESAALAADVEAAPRLFTEAPRTLAASLAAGHAQHLVVLRRGLGTPLAEAFPKPFGTGEIPPPGGETPRRKE